MYQRGTSAEAEIIGKLPFRNKQRGYRPTETLRIKGSRRAVPRGDDDDDDTGLLVVRYKKNNSPYTIINFNKNSSVFWVISRREVV